MKRFFLLILVNFCFTLNSANLFAEDKENLLKNELNLTDQEQIWLTQHPNLRFTGDPNWLPFEAFDQQQNYIGIVAEHLQLIEQKLNIKFTKIPTKSWSESVRLAKSGEVDILSETDDSALKSHLLFSDFYLVNPVVIVMGLNQNYVENLDEIKDKTIGVIKDYGYVTKITEKYTEHQFKVVDDIQDGLLAVTTGRVDALLCTVTLCGYTMARLGLHDIKIVGKTEFETRLAFGINQSLAEFVPILNKAIANTTEEQRQQILARWSNAAYLDDTDFTLIWVLLGASLIILLFLVYRQIQLRAYNEKISQSEKRYARVVRGTSDGFWDWNIITNQKYFSPRFEALLGFQEGGISITEDPFFELVHPDDLERLKKMLDAHLRKEGEYDIEVRVKKYSGDYQWFRNTGQAEWGESGSPVKMAGYLSDISERKLVESLAKTRNFVLESVARGQSFHKVLNTIVSSVEKENNKMICSILLFDAKAGVLTIGAAPNLPEFFNQVIDGLKAGKGIGSSGTAAVTGQRVIVEDIQTHPFWVDYKELAASAKLASCWSEPIFSSNGKVVGTLAVYQKTISKPTSNDILVIEQTATLAGIVIEKHHSMDQLQLASMVYQNSSEAMLIFDADRTIISVNPAFTKITGYTADEVLGQKADILNSQFHGSDFYEALQSQVKRTGFWQGEVIDRRKNGEKYVKWLIINTIYNDDGSVHRRLSLFSDITEKRQSEETIWKQANFDSLTGLPNRNMFQERLAREINHSKRDNLKFALLLIDLDHFKEVNDTLGHDVGDRLLIEATKRIVSSVRETDTVARLGGDEFTVIMTEIDGSENVERIAQQIVHKLSAPFQLNNEDTYISASVGITFYPEDSTESEVLLKNADQAMYESKKLGRNRYRYFTLAMQETAQLRMQLISDLRKAVGEQQFSLEYQPIIDLVTNRIYKAEALIRWNHPEKGLIDPVDFISTAEDTGIIIPIGDWVMNQAAKQVAEWRNNYSNEFQISVNTSPIQYQKDGFDFASWSKQLKSLNLPGEAIIFEITESLMMDASARVIEQLIAFRNLGIQVALDDFGTGYSSLSYLKKFDIDYIKIDKIFVCNLEADHDNRTLCEAIIMMAHKFNLKVIAEGVETQIQKSILTEIGCDYGQGFFFSKAVDKNKFEEIFLKA